MFGPQEKAILTGWRERTGTKLRRFSLWPQHYPEAPTGATMDPIKSFSAYDIPSVEALIRYLHADAGFPV